MSGHSKWSTIKHKKAAADSKRGKVFTKILKEITVAARTGGGDPVGNPRLRSAILEARSNNVPNDNIDRAIKKGTGALEGSTFEEVVYEGYGPGGVAVLVEAATDNRNRTGSEVRHLFSKHGGNLGEAGCVSWMFSKRGYFALDRSAIDEEKLMDLALEIGVEDVAVEDDVYEIYTTAEEYLRVREALEHHGLRPQAQELAMVPQTYVELASDRARQVVKLMELLEDHDDVQHVWANCEFDGELVARAE